MNFRKHISSVHKRVVSPSAFVRRAYEPILRGKIGFFCILIALQGYAQTYYWSTIAGAAGASGSTDGTGSSARFTRPNSVAVDQAGNVYVGDGGNYIIRKIAPSGVVTTIAGSAGVTGSVDGTGSTAKFGTIGDLALDNTGNIIVGDFGNNTIRRIAPSGAVATIAGSAGVSGSVDGAGSIARFSSPVGVASDGKGNIYVADLGSATIRLISSNGVVSTVAGQPGVRGVIDGIASQATFAGPDHLCVDSSGNVFVVDQPAARIRKISPDGTVSTFANLGSLQLMPADIGIAISASSDLFVAIQSAYTIHKLNSTGIATAIGGSSGISGSKDGTGLASRFNGAAGLTADFTGTVYVADALNHTIRKGAAAAAPSITRQPTNQIVSEGENAAFSAAAAGVPAPTLRWQRSIDNGMSWNDLTDSALVQASGTGNLLLIAASADISGNQFRIRAANDSGPDALGDSAILTVTPIAPSITVQPRSTTAVVGADVTFSVTASGTQPLSYQWRSNGTNISGTTNAMYTISNVQTSQSGSYSVTVSNSIGSATSSNAILLVTQTRMSLVPGMIQAEDFDEGGEGVAYHSKENRNTGYYRPTTVPIYPSTDSGGGFMIMLRGRGDAYQQEDWVNYTVYVDDPGIYSIHARVSADGVVTPASMHFEVDGVYKTAPIALLGWAASHFGWNTYAASYVRLSRGIHVIRLSVDLGWGNMVGGFLGVNINYINVVRATTMPASVFAGSVDAGFKDGQDVSALFSSSISGLGAASDGTVFVGDAGNFRVRKISPAGLVTTLAGTGTTGENDGPGAQAAFGDLGELGIDKTGNCYILDTGVSSAKIRRITPDGVVSTVWTESRVSGLPRFTSLAVADNSDCYFVRNGAEVLKLAADNNPVVVGSAIAGSQIRGVNRFENNSVAFLVYGGQTASGYQNAWQIVTGLTNQPLLTIPSISRYLIDSFLFDTSKNLNFVSGSYLSKLWPDGGVEALVSTFTALHIAIDGSGNLYGSERSQIFKLANYPGLIVQVTTEGGGTIKLNPGPGPHLSNTVVQVSATANSGWTFLGWSGDVSNDAKNLTIQLTNHVFLKAIFGTPLTTAIANGVIIRNPELSLYPYGTQVTLTALPDVGYKFIQWSDGVTTASRAVTVTTSQIYLQAQLTALPLYSLNAVALGGTGGTVLRNPPQADYYRETVVTLTAVPNPGYVFQTWLDGSISNPRTLTITSNTTLFAVFAASSGNAPRIAVAPKDATVLVGEPVLMSAQPDGFGPFGYQWQLSGTNLPSATNSFVVLAHAKSTDAGVYSVIVTNAFGSVTTSARLTVTAVAGVKFTMIPQVSNSQLQLNLAGDAGKKYQLESSTNLTTWSPVVTLDNPFGVFQFSEPLTNSIQRKYYRAVQIQSP